MMSNLHRNSEKGATALFIVIFSILLMSTITISFLSLMVSEQQRSINDELSQSAYDSALAGVEDAKRAIVASRGTGPLASPAKTALSDSQKPGGCQAIGVYVNNTDPDLNETPIQSSSSSAGAELNQAYTCLKVNNLTDSFQANVEDQAVVLVPLRMADEINQIKISWQRASDISGVLYTSTGTPLLTHTDWNTQKTPAMLRVQAITPTNSFSLTDFDSADTSSTIFLYPATTGAGEVSGIGLDMPGNRAGQLALSNKPEAVECINGSGLTNAININSYLCSVTIKLNSSVQQGSDISYLAIGSIYRETGIEVQGLMDGKLVQFDGAQPTVDSTGRANDLFRRVEARLTLGGEGESGSGLGGVIPQYALDVDGSICKSFYVSVGLSGEFGQKCQPKPATP